MMDKPAAGMPDDEWWYDSQERKELLDIMRKLAIVPVWVTVAMHILLVLIAVNQLGNTVMSYKNLESNVRTEALLEQLTSATQQSVNEAQLQNAFWRRNDSIRAERERTDSTGRR